MQRTPSQQSLDLPQAIERAFEQNPVVKLSRLSYREAEIQYQNAWDTFFLPSISLTANTSSAYTLGTIGETAARRQKDTVREYGYPSSTLGLSLGSYTLFNGFKDQIAYRIAKLVFERESEKLKEAQRQVRNTVVNQYFSLRTAQEKLEAANRSLAISQALFELVRTQNQLKRKTAADLSSARNDVLTARGDLILQEQAVQDQLRAMNFLLGDPIGTLYTLKSQLKFNKVQVKSDEAFKLAYQQNPAVRDQKLLLNQAEATVNLAERNRIPLPKVSFSGVTLSYGDKYYPGDPTRTTGSTPVEGNFNLIVAVALTVPLVGPGGLLNSREVSLARIGLERAQVNYHQGIQQLNLDTFQISDNLVRLETQVVQTMEQLKNSAEILEDALQKVARGEASRLDLRDALLVARQTEFAYKDALLAHLAEKLRLSNILNVDQLPGDDYVEK